MGELIFYSIIYLIGFCITLLVLIIFGKKLGFDYDPPHPPEYDDYKSSGEAYFSFACVWIIFVPIMLLYNLCSWLIKIINKWIN